MPKAYLQTDTSAKAGFSPMSAFPMATHPITLLTATFTSLPPRQSCDHSGKHGQKEQSHQQILCFHFSICSRL